MAGEKFCVRNRDVGSAVAPADMTMWPVVPVPNLPVDGNAEAPTLDNLDHTATIRQGAPNVKNEPVARWTVTFCGRNTLERLFPTGYRVEAK
jgi:hypothetical protein